MKRIITLIFLISLVITLSSCDRNTIKELNSNEVDVLNPSVKPTNPENSSEPSNNETSDMDDNKPNNGNDNVPSDLEDNKSTDISDIKSTDLSDNKPTDIDELGQSIEDIEPEESTDIKLVYTSGNPDIDEFNQLSESFIQYDFQAEIIETSEFSDSFLVTGEYDLNQDGKNDEIKISMVGYSSRRTDSTYVEVNGQKTEFYIDYTSDGEVRIIDLDMEDQFLELACFDEGPSGDPCYIFFRYDGEKVYQLGEIDAYGFINGKGSIISGFHYSDFQPYFYSAWYDIEDNHFVLKNNNIDEYLGKSYEYSGGEAFFVPIEGDEIPEDIEIRWEEIMQFEPCEIVLLDVFMYGEDRTLNFYFVEFPEGVKGLLYFWIGD